MAYGKGKNSSRTFPAKSPGTDSTQKKYSSGSNSPALGGGTGKGVGKYNGAVKTSGKP